MLVGTFYRLEEPLAADDYEAYRPLSDALPIRIAAGEADSGIKPFRALVEQGHVDVLQPDFGRGGGFKVLRQIAALAREVGVEVVPHGFSARVLVAASLHFAATLNRPTQSEFSVADSPLVAQMRVQSCRDRVRPRLVGISRRDLGGAARSR